jgi:hypothetical protein
MRFGIVCASLIALLLLPTTSLAAVSGTASVDYGSGEFEGYWCYTIEITWDAPNDLSNASAFVGLEGLACACDPGVFLFSTPAGTSTGTGEGGICELDYVGTYLCSGDPSLPPEYANVTAVRWDPSPEVCNAGTSGSATLVFYSLLAPGQDQIYPDAVSIKSGLDTFVGNLTGVLPAADCGVDHEHESLGQLKARF